MAARCETVLNTTMAEMETYHIQKGEDFCTLTKEHLDGEIAFYEQVLSPITTHNFFLADWNTIPGFKSTSNCTARL